MSTEKSNILIVDDNEDHQQLMEYALKQFIRDANIVYSSTGEECLLALSKESFDAVVIDFNLSDMDGLDVLRNINSMKYNIPVVMVTAFGDEIIAVKAIKLGAYDYIVKADDYLNRLPVIIHRAIQEPNLKREKQKAEDDLRVSELKYKTLIDNMVDVVFTADKDMNIISINNAGQRVFEYSCEDIMGLNFVDLIYEPDREKIVDCIRGSFAGKREFLEGFEFRIKTGNDRIKDVQLNAKMDYNDNDDVACFEGVVRDITGRKEFEQKLFQIDKLNALGLQSSGVAHEFNNILGIILGYLQIVKEEIGDVSGQVLDALGIIEKAARDGSEIVDKIQQFSRIKKEHEKKEELIDLVDVINDAFEFTMPRWKTEAQSKGVEYEIIKSDFVPSKYRTRCNPSELREVIINIINNSIDAMPDGGKIETSMKTDEDNVVIAISDNGIGIQDEVKDKIFDPFFSTKGVKRSGLGMSLSYSIMTRHDGEILVKSAVGKGTTMYLKIPLFNEEIELFEGEDAGTIESHSANILIIEDEDVILDMMKILLESRGHIVSVTPDSRVGIEMYESNRYDIVLCDLAMPNLNGWQVAKFIKEYDALNKRTKTPVVLITGYELDADNIDYKKEGVDFILNKPIEYDMLYKIISKYSTAQFHKK